MIVERKAADTWPHVLIPEKATFPLALFDFPKERVLHIALKDDFEQQPGLSTALKSLTERNDFSEIPWPAHTHNLSNMIFEAAKRIKPTLVFMQIQRSNVITSDVINTLRSLSDPRCVVVHWDGDQHYEPTDPERSWFVELGRFCDTSLVCNTRHPHAYRTLGVKHPGYLQIGTDDRWLPAAPTLHTPSIVFLAGGYPGYIWRREVVSRLEKWLGPSEFGVYGNGWDGFQSARPFVRQTLESGVYSGSKAALSMSIRSDLPRYTSDRLFRALSSGALVMVEEFPEMEGLGLNESNCLKWTSWEDLKLRIEGVFSGEMRKQTAMRKAAFDLAQDHHQWSHRMPELMAIVDAVRRAR